MVVIHVRHWEGHSTPVESEIVYTDADTYEVHCVGDEMVLDVYKEGQPIATFRDWYYVEVK